jgi:hypothetical protein
MEGLNMNENNIAAIRAEVQKRHDEAAAELAPYLEACDSDEEYDDTVTRLELQGYTDALAEVLELLA